MKKILKILTALLCIFSLVSCSAQTSDVPELLEPVGVELDTSLVTTGDLVKKSSYQAVVVPYVEDLYFESSGILSQSNIKLGDTVNEGDLLVELDISNLEEQIETVEDSIAYNKTINEYTNSQLEIKIEIAELTYEKLLAQAQLYDDYYDELAKAEEEKAKAELAKQAEEESSQEESSQEESSQEESSQEESSQEEEYQIEIEKPEGNDVSDGELVLAKADIETAELNLKSAKETQALTLEELNDTLENLNDSLVNNKIYAPFSGTIVYFNNLIEGDSVKDLEVLICIADETRLTIQSEYISNMTMSSLEKITALINGTEYDISYVEMTSSEYVSLTLSNQTVTTEFEFIDENITAKSGDFVNLYLYQSTQTDVLLVPTNAIFGTSSEYYVYKVVDDSLVKTIVTRGKDNGVYAEITEGLEEGEYVYVEN
ncbi:MAG: efflux RND transporter periplasmic adaptor subunit [Clostridia bacterium]